MRFLSPKNAAKWDFKAPKCSKERILRPKWLVFLHFASRSPVPTLWAPYGSGTQRPASPAPPFPSGPKSRPCIIMIWFHFHVSFPNLVSLEAPALSDPPARGRGKSRPGFSQRVPPIRPVINRNKGKNTPKTIKTINKTVPGWLRLMAELLLDLFNGHFIYFLIIFAVKFSLRSLNSQRGLLRFNSGLGFTWIRRLNPNARGHRTLRLLIPYRVNTL